MKHLFTLLLLGGASATAQSAFAQAADITNNGATIALTNGAILYTTGAVTNAAGSTLNLGTGTQSQLHVGGNFVNSGTIVPGNGAVLLIGTTPQTLNLNGATPSGSAATPATIYDLTVNNSAAGNAVNVTSNVAVGNVLTFGASSGRLATTTATTVTLPAGASISASNGGETNAHYVLGNLRTERTAVSGAAAIDFGNGAVINPNSNNLGSVAVVRSAGLQANNLSQGVNNANSSIKGIDQVWRIIPATQPATAVNVQLTWLSANDNGIASFAQTRMWRRESAAATWVAVGPYASGTTRTFAGAVVGPLYQVTVSALSNPLPVELLSFAAERRGEAARLNWRTASEKNNDYFGVEVSVDGRSYREFARVAGRGNSTTPQDYELYDPALMTYRTDLVYYRLRQVDTDGTVTYSPVATVQVPFAGFAASAAPNPLNNDGTRIRISTGAAGPAELAVYDGVGRLMMGRRTELKIGTNEVDLTDAGQLASGVYFLKVSQGTQHAMLKLVRE